MKDDKVNFFKADNQIGLSIKFGLPITAFGDNKEMLLEYFRTQLDGIYDIMKEGVDDLNTDNLPTAVLDKEGFDNEVVNYFKDNENVLSIHQILTPNSYYDDELTPTYIIILNEEDNKLRDETINYFTSFPLTYFSEIQPAFLFTTNNDVIESLNTTDGSRLIKLK